MKWTSRSASASVSSSATSGKRALEAVDREAQLGPGGGLVGLVEDRAHEGAHDAPGRARHEVPRVACEVGPEALPGGPEEVLVDGREPCVGIADDEPHTREATFDEGAHEAGRPALGSSVETDKEFTEQSARTGSLNNNNWS